MAINNDNRLFFGVSSSTRILFILPLIFSFAQYVDVSRQSGSLDKEILVDLVPYLFHPADSGGAGLSGDPGELGGY